MFIIHVLLEKQKQITERLDYLSQKNHSTTRNLLQKNPKPNTIEKSNTYFPIFKTPSKTSTTMYILNKLLLRRTI